MLTPILATKLYIPPPRLKVVLRPNLIERLNEGLRQNQGFGRKLTLISAQPGQRMGRRVQATGGLAVAGRRG
jgi:LuxR family maltose regulon positive regulatory protein